MEDVPWSQDVRALVGAVFTHRVMAAWAPHLGSVSHPHPGEQALRLEHGLADCLLQRRRTCTWLGDEANVKPLPLVDQKPEGPGNYRTFPSIVSTGTALASGLETAEAVLRDLGTPSALAATAGAFRLGRMPRG